MLTSTPTKKMHPPLTFPKHFCGPGGPCSQKTALRAGGPAASSEAPWDLSRHSEEPRSGQYAPVAHQPQVCAVRRLRPAAFSIRYPTVAMGGPPTETTGAPNPLMRVRGSVMQQDLILIGESHLLVGILLPVSKAVRTLPICFSRYTGQRRRAISDRTTAEPGTCPRICS